jgi:hypothetical protein
VVYSNYRSCNSGVFFNWPLYRHSGTGSAWGICRSQLVQAYDQRQSQGQITGPAAASLRRDLSALGAALGV